MDVQADIFFNHYIMFITCILTSGQLACDPPGNDVAVWNETIENSTTAVVDVDVENKQKLCSGPATCQPDVPGSGQLQLSPLSLWRGQTLRLSLPDGWNASNVAVYSTDRAGFDTCTVSDDVVLPVVVSDTQVNISSQLLTPGIHYLLFEVSGNLSLDCDQGSRVIITVKDTRCRPEDQGSVCSGSGFCTLDQNQFVYTCSCCNGYSGVYCENHQSSEASPCTNITCQNGGTCVPETADETQRSDTNTSGISMSSRCVCNPHFTGTSCETRLDSCKSNPCKHGVCQEEGSGYQCFCVPGFHGKQCDLEYNECLSHPCKHGGTCIDRVDKYECACTRGYTGNTCQTKVNLCSPNPCHLNASCVDVGNAFHCSCPPGHTGRVCEIRINECRSNPCQNQGTCIDRDNGFECTCPLTFAGVHCEYMLDVFAPPLEGADLTGSTHVHNLYILAGTLSGAILLGVCVLFACYCKMHETYKQITWRRGGYKRRSLSCPDLESINDVASINKPRLSVGAIWEATSLCHENASLETQQQLHANRI